MIDTSLWDNLTDKMIEIPSAIEMGKKAAAAYDQKQKARKAVKEAIESAAAGGHFCVSIQGRLADPIVNELKGLGYRVVYEGDSCAYFCGGPFNTIIGWREVE